MTLEQQVAVGVKNAFARQPIVDRVRIVRTLRRANRPLGRSLGRVEWAGSLEAYICRSADLLLEGWTPDDDGPLTPPKQVWARSVGRSHRRLDALEAIERRMWETERAAHTSPSEPVAAAARLPQRDRGAVSGLQLSTGCGKRRGARGEGSATADARVRRRQGLEVARREMGADARSDLAAVPCRDRTLPRRRAVCRRFLQTRGRDQNDPDRAAPLATSAGGAPRVR
jgi:hypothetical protein